MPEYVETALWLMVIFWVNVWLVLVTFGRPAAMKVAGDVWERGKGAVEALVFRKSEPKSLQDMGG